MKSQKKGAPGAPLRVWGGEGALLDGLAVEGEVEPVALDLDVDPQANHEIHDLEDDERGDHVIEDDDADADQLVDHLAGVALDEARGAAVLADCEDAREDGT